jgi:acyl-CoA synthetase (AMP-forming)/AMP-acid ligase II
MRVIDYFDRGAEGNLDRIAIMDETKRYTYAEAQEASHKIAWAMWHAGLGEDDAVAIYSPNDPDVMICLLGLLRAGAVWIPVNARNALDANVQYMTYVRTKWLFYHSDFAADVAKLKAQIPTLTKFVCLDKEMDGDPCLKDFMATGSPADDKDWADPFGNPDTVVGIFATGGTTGPAKGMNVTNLGWGTMLEIQKNYWEVPGLEKPVCLSSAPLTHAAGVVALACSTFGATNVIMKSFNAAEMLKNIEKYKVTHTFVPPTALYMLLDCPDIGKYDYSSLKMFLLVASPVAPDKLKRAVEVFGPCMCQSYGQVEAPMILTWLPQADVAAAAAGDHPERLRSCGKASYAVKVGIMDDEGNLLPDGQVGEIVARGTLVSHSYFEKPEATADVRRFGWHHTGDVGYRDKDGYFYIVDRKKDMVVTGGFNVYSSEVEGTIMEMPQVRECAVIGVPDAKWGEAIKAIVATSNGGTLSDQDVMTYCKTKLGSVKTPKSVEFWPDLPKTANGKMDKKSIRQKFWEGQERSVG